DGHQEIVATLVARLEVAVTPQMRDRVDGPGGVQMDNGAQEDAPDQPAKPQLQGTLRGPGPQEANQGTEAEENRPLHDVQDTPDPGPFEAFVEAVLEQVAGVAVVEGYVVNGGIVDQEPAHVAPEDACLRAVGVAGLVGVLMMQAVDRDPAHGRALPAAGAE